MNISDEAVEAAVAARLTFKNQRGMDNAANLMRHILEAAAPHLMAKALEEAALALRDAASWSGSEPGPELIGRWLRSRAAAYRSAGAGE